MLTVNKLVAAGPRPGAGAAQARRQRRARLGRALQEPLRRHRFGRPHARRVPAARPGGARRRRAGGRGRLAGARAAPRRSRCWWCAIAPSMARPSTCCARPTTWATAMCSSSCKPDRLQLEPDHVLADMLRQMHLIVSEEQAPFEPEAGAYAQGGHGAHGHAHDAHGTHVQPRLPRKPRPRACARAGLRPRPRRTDGRARRRRRRRCCS